MTTGPSQRRLRWSTSTRVKINADRGKSLAGKKRRKESTAKDRTGNCALRWRPVYHVTRGTYKNPTATLVTTRRNTAHFQVQLYCRCTLWQCLLNDMCKKKQNNLYFKTIHIHGLLNKTSLTAHMPVMEMLSQDSCCHLSRLWLWGTLRISL